MIHIALNIVVCKSGNVRMTYYWIRVAVVGYIGRISRNSRSGVEMALSIFVDSYICR